MRFDFFWIFLNTHKKKLHLPPPPSSSSFHAAIRARRSSLVSLSLSLLRRPPPPPPPPPRRCFFPLRTTRRHEIPPISVVVADAPASWTTRTAEESSTAPPSLERSTARTRLLVFSSFFSLEGEGEREAKGHLPPLATTSNDPGTRGAPLGGGSTGGTRSTAPRCLRAETTATARPLREAAAARAAPAASAQETAATGSSSSPSAAPTFESFSSPRRRRGGGRVATARGIVGLVEPGCSGKKSRRKKKVRAPLVFVGRAFETNEKKNQSIHLLQALENDLVPRSIDHALLLVDLGEPQCGDTGRDGPHARLGRRGRVGVVVGGVVSIGGRRCPLSSPPLMEESEAASLSFLLASHSARD